MGRNTDEWLWGWDKTPGIVSVWAEPDGCATLWRRAGDPRTLVCEQARFRPWVLLASLDDLRHLGDRLREEGPEIAPGQLAFRELKGEGALRFLVTADDERALHGAILAGAARRLGRPLRHVRELGAEAVLVLPPEEQYLVATGRTYFGDLTFDDLARAQLDLETTGLDPRVDRVFLIALRGPDGKTELLESAAPMKAAPVGAAAGSRAAGNPAAADAAEADAAEADLLRRLVAWVRRVDPDVIENHNLHGFDLPFLAARAHTLGVSLGLGRGPSPGLRRRPAARGANLPGDDDAQVSPGARDAMRRSRFTVPGRELIDTLDAVRRHDFSARDLPSHGLKDVARHFGLAHETRERIAGAQVYATYRRDPERVRRYAAEDVFEAAGVARLLGGAAFALARMAPRRYERLADAGAATGVLDPLLVRAYLRAGAALPAHEPGDATTHSGAALHLFAAGVAQRVIKADVASLYPSLMREYKIGPRRDRLGALLAIVDQLVERRLAAKAAARLARPASPERHAHEAMSAAMKLVINSAYGYLAAVGLTRFADVHAANEVTRHGRELLGLICRELAARGLTLLEADTDGVYAAVPAAFSEADERRVVAEVAALLPTLVHLEFDGRYAAMLSHEPKNYALLGHDGALILRGVAFRSSRAEAFGEDFLRRALTCLLAGDVPGVRDAYVHTWQALRRRELPTRSVTQLVRLTKSPDEYLALRAKRRELPYEALLTGGHTRWAVGQRVRIYRAKGGRAGLFDDDEADKDKPQAEVTPQTPDYDVAYYIRILRDTFAARLARAFVPEDFATLFADPEQPSLFERPLATIQPVLTTNLATHDLCEQA